MSEVPAGAGDDLDGYTVARARIAAQKGILRGWRPLEVGDVAVVALQVLGMVAGDPTSVGLQVIVAGRDREVLAAQGLRAAEQALRRRSVLGQDDLFEVVRWGDFSIPAGLDQTNDPLSWPYMPLIIHVPVGQLPAIAGLATDAVHG